ncbi:MAG: hypothetical protein ACHREM_26940, partial [Polyangiales bacterium]
DAVEKIREIVAASGYRAIIHPTWGGLEVLAPHEKDPLPEIPAWLVTEESKKLRKLFEFKLGRQLTPNEIETIVREAAEERLQARQVAALATTGHDLREQESAKRSDRRRRARAQRVRYAPTLQERLRNAVAEHPDANVPDLARTLRARIQTVSEELRRMEKDGEITTEKRGRGVYRSVSQTCPPILDGETRVRVAAARVRVPGDVDEAVDVEEPAISRALKRLR